MFMAQAVQAQAPKTISYQGKIVDANGNTLTNGAYNIKFSLYTSESGGSPAWEETQGVNVRNGVFGAMLGQNNNLNLTFDRSYWLGVKVGNDPEMSPRSPLASTPYSMHASSVASNAVKTGNIANGAVTTDKLANGAITADKIAPNALPTLSIGDNAVATRNLANGAVTTAKLANGAITADKIAPNALPTLSLNDNSVATRHIANGAVTAAKLASGAVAAGLGNNSIGTQHIANGAITADKIAANALPSLSLNDNAVGTRHLQDGAVKGDKLGDEAVEKYHIKPDAVKTRHIEDRNITADKIGAKVINDDHIETYGITPHAKLKAGQAGQVLTTVNGKAQWTNQNGPGRFKMKTVTSQIAHVLDHPDLNQNSRAVVIVQHELRTQNVAPFSIAYNGGKWWMTSTDTIFEGEVFHIIYYKN